MKMYSNQQDELLISFGLDVDVVSNLSAELKKSVITFIENYHFDSHELFLKKVMQIIKLELNGKKGAAYLIANRIANSDQIKLLSSEQIANVIVEFKSNDKSSAESLLYDYITEYQEKKRQSILAKRYEVEL